MKFAFIDAHAPKKHAPVDGINRFPVNYMCDRLEVSTAGYYAWRRREPSQREKDDQVLKRKITALFDYHKGRYGVRRIFAELKRGGMAVAYKRVARLMAELGLVSAHRRRRRVRTTVPGPGGHALPDLLAGDFTAQRPNVKWYGDITYVPTWEGFAYVASVIDACTKKVVGWSVADHMRTELVIDAMDMALSSQRPHRGVIFHADRGSQYTSTKFINYCRSNGVRNSVGRTGNCYDNAAAESFWATLKKECLHRRPFDTAARVRSGVFEYIETYYNRERLHSTIGYVTPIEYESAIDNRMAQAA